ncbi:MAG TPA: xanthine dehydrogenase family protein molybdopterin-binding subunit, partial [Burkholderiaceae bacterium]
MSSTIENLATRFGSGRAVKRVEDASLLVGKGQFVDNVLVADQAHVAFLRSPYAHARILSVDASAALAMPGVVAVFSGADLVQAGVKSLSQPLPFPRPDGKPG